MRKSIIAVAVAAFSFGATAQTTYDSSTLVDSNTVNTTTTTNNNNNVNTSTSTATSTSTNTNVNTSTSDNTNTNINSGDMTNRSIMSGEVTYKNVQSGTLTNVNQNTSASTQEVNSNNVNRNDSNITQKIVQPPPTAIAPPMMSGGNADLCTTGASAAVQTQIFGLSMGGTTRDLNCERLKLSKTLFDMGMKVAAVATMCQDRRVFDAMMQAGTPCPYQGLIGEQARTAWSANPSKLPKPIKE
jgi:hypothetical protein